jgi:hypothetical protein
MEKAKKITAEQLRAANTAPTNRTVMWHGIAVTVRPMLPLAEVTQFVNSVMDSCYDKGRDMFVPDMKDFAFRVNVVSRYACVELPPSIEEQYAILYNTDIFDTIMSHINQPQIESIKDAINTCMKI